MAQMRPVAHNITVKPVVPRAYLRAKNVRREICTGLNGCLGSRARTLSAWLKEQANDLPVIAKRLLCWRWRSCGPLSFVAKTKFGSGVP